MISIELIKEAGVLRKRLQKGSINIHEMEQFLAKVEALASPSARNKLSYDRFIEQMENLDRGHARKPKVTHAQRVAKYMIPKDKRK